MTENQIVIGGGIAGVSAALMLRRAGLNVTLIDPLPSPGGSSFGNAGIISRDTVVPIAVPGMLRKVPGWLLDPVGPLTIKTSYLPQVTPWLLRWLKNSRMETVLTISDALRALHRPVFEVYREMLGPSGYDDLLRPFGHVQLWDGEAESRAAAIERQIRARHGVEAHPLSAAELRGMFPDLANLAMRGIMIPGNGHTVSPRRLVSHLAALAQSEGVRFLPEKALKLIPAGSGTWTVMTNAANHKASRVLVAAGAWSMTLLKSLGVRIPLETERGYHVMYGRPSVQLSHTVLHKDWGISFSPFEEGMCASGTVEIAGLHAPPDERRAQVIARRAKQLFPNLHSDEPSIWIGFRPSMPDSLPVIGAVPRQAGLFLLFGHGHNGMTGGPTGARLVTELMLGKEPFIDPAPYDARRFA